MLAEAVEAFLHQKEVEGLSPRTIEGYRKRLVLVVAFLKRRGVLLAADVTPDDLDAYLADQAARGLKRRTQLDTASTMRECFRLMQSSGLVLMNPARDLPIAEEGEEELPEPPLSEAEVMALLAALPRASVIDLRNRAHVELLYGAALRLRESVMLDVSDIDFQRRTVLVRDGKGGRDGLVPLVQGTAGAVKDYIAERRSLLKGPDHGALLLDNRGQRLADFNIRPYLRAMGKRHLGGRRLHPHLFRHSLAVHMLRGGADIRHVQQFLRHASLETTKVYLRMVPGHLRVEYDRAFPAIDVGL